MSIKNLYIVGASHLGREMLAWLKDSPDYNVKWKIKGFLHEYEDKSPLDGYPCEFDIIGGWQDFDYQKNDLAVLAVGDGYWRQKIFETLEDRVEFLTYVHPTSIVKEDTILGKGVLVTPFCTISVNCTLGNGVFLNGHVTVGHDATIGDFSTVLPGSVITGGVRIGSNVTLGSNSTIIPKVSVGNDITLGAGSTLFGSIRKPGTYIGNPAKLFAAK